MRKSVNRHATFRRIFGNSAELARWQASSPPPYELALIELREIRTACIKDACPNYHHMTSERLPLKRAEMSPQSAT